MLVLLRILYPVVVSAGIRLFGVVPLPGVYPATADMLSAFGLNHPGASFGWCSGLSLETHGSQNDPPKHPKINQNLPQNYPKTSQNLPWGP